MNRLALLLVAATFFATAHPVFAEDTTPPSFEEHPGICKIHAAPARLVPGTKEWDFRTRIREGTDGACPDFDGAFKVTTWGCGTECQGGVITDLTDGKIYWLPDVASYGYEYHGESSLLIVNQFSKADFTDGEVPDWLWREFYEFSHGEWKLLYSDKGGE